jgi:acetate kinase
MANGIIVINSGSTSVKFAAFRGDRADSLDLICRGQVDGIGSMPRFSAKNANSEVMDTHAWDEARSLDREKALGFVIRWLESREKDLKTVGVGHRVVQGGPYNKPVLVDEAVLQELRKLEAITPSHQPFELEGIRTLAKAHPRLLRSSTLRFTGPCQLWLSATHCPRRFSAIKFGIGAITAFRMTTFHAFCRATRPTRDA